MWLSVLSKPEEFVDVINSGLVRSFGGIDLDQQRQAITRNNVDLSSVRSNAKHKRASLQEILQQSIISDKPLSEPILVYC